MPTKPSTPQVEPEAEAEITETSPLEVTTLPGWHVTRVDDGMLLGIYMTEQDAEHFANSHPREAGIEVEITFHQ